MLKRLAIVAIAVVLQTWLPLRLQGQTPNFALSPGSTHPVRQIGLNIGASTYYDSYLLKNLIIVNPGMQPQMVKQINRISAGTASPYTFTTTADYDAQLANASQNWRVTFDCHGNQGALPGTCAGGIAGVSGAVTANTVNDGSSGTMTYTFTPDSGTPPAPAQYDSVRIESPAGMTTTAGQLSAGWGTFGWQPSTTGSGSVSIDTTTGDLPPTLNDFATAQQCVKMSITGGGDSAQMLTYFDTTGNLNYNFNGTFHMGAMVSVLSGSGGIITVRVQRVSSGLNMSNTFSLSGGWTDYSTAMSAAESTSAAGGNVQITLTLTGSSATTICMVGAHLTNDADNNTTAYRNQILSNFQFIKAGTARYNSTGQQGSSLLNLITPLAYRQPSAVGAATGGGQVEVQQGLYDFLILQETLGTQAVSIVVPPVSSNAELNNWVDFLAGPNTGTCTPATLAAGTANYGACRAALGHAAAFTSSFQKIILEYGNETWNSSLDAGRAGYPVGYPSGYWNYIKIAVNACTTLKANGNWNSVLKCGVSNWTAVGSYFIGLFQAVDTANKIDYQNVSQYVGADSGNPLTHCTNPDMQVAAMTQAWAFGNDPGDTTGFYEALAAGTAGYTYEYNNHSLFGNCNQSQLSGYANGQGYALVDVLSALWGNKHFGVTEQSFWQQFVPYSTDSNSNSVPIFGITTGPGGAYVNYRQAAYALALANGCIGTGNTRFDTAATNVTTYNFPGYNGVNAVNGVPTLQEFAFKNGTNRCLLVANVDQSSASNFTISGTDAPTGSTGSITKVVFTSASVNDTCEGANAAPCNSNTTSTVSAGTQTIPAHSLASFTWSVSAPVTCTLVANQPQYGYQTLPGSERQLIVHQTGCPTSAVSNITVAGSTLTATVVDATVFTVGKQVVFTGFTSYPFDRLIEGVSLTITGASGTTLTASFPNAPFAQSSTAISGTATQNTLVNWSTTSGTLSCTSNCIPTVTFTSDATAGALSTVQPASPYPGGGYTLTSTHQMTVTATPVDGGTPASFVINQAAVGTIVRLNTTYTQAYLNQPMLFWSTITGNTNANVTWGVTGTGCSIVGGIANKRNVLVNGASTGTCTVTATSVADGTKTASTSMFVANAAIPAWASAPPGNLPPTPCAIDGSKTLYEVGPGQTYTTLNAVPWRTLTVPWEVRVHYATYAEYIQITSIGNGSSNYLCGVEDGSGHYPLLTAVNAHGPTWFTNSFLLGLGLITAFPNSGGCSTSADSTGSCGPTNLSIAGLALTGVNPGNTYVLPDGVTTGNWQNGASCISVRTGANIAVDAVSCVNSTQGVGTYANQNGGYPSLSQNVYVGRSYFSQNGLNNDSSDHPLYLQSLYANIVDRVYVDTPVTGSAGSGFKARGQGNIIFASNIPAINVGRCCDFVEAQDDAAWIAFEDALASGSLYNGAAYNFTLDGEAARQESMFKDFFFGNVVQSAQFHYLADHNDNIGDFGMNARYGKLFSFFNTFTNIGSGFDTSNQYGLNYFLAQRFYLANNILWQPGSYAINTEAMFIGDFHTNLSVAGLQANTTPIWGKYYADGGTLGWVGKTQDVNTYIMVRPLSAHVSGNLVSDFLTTGTQPFNGTTFTATGAAVLAASALSGPASEFQIPFNAVVTPGVYTTRTTVNNLGAVEVGVAPPTGLQGQVMGQGKSIGTGTTF